MRGLGDRNGAGADRLKTLRRVWITEAGKLNCCDAPTIRAKILYRSLLPARFREVGEGCGRRKATTAPPSSLPPRS